MSESIEAAASVAEAGAAASVAAVAADEAADSAQAAAAAASEALAAAAVLTAQAEAEALEAAVEARAEIEETIEQTADNAEAIQWLRNDLAELRTDVRQRLDSLGEQMAAFLSGVQTGAIAMTEIQQPTEEPLPGSTSLTPEPGPDNHPPETVGSPASEPEPEPEPEPAPPPKRRHRPRF